MFETQGLTVSRLIRTRFGKIELPPRLARGKLMELDVGQVNGVLGWVGMKVEGSVPGQTAPHAKKPRREPRGSGDSANAHPLPERGNELGPVIDLDAIDAADDIGNALVVATPHHAEHAEGDEPVAPIRNNERGERSGRGGLRGRGGRGRGGERGRRPAPAAIATDGFRAPPNPGSPGNAMPEIDGNRGGNGAGPGAVPAGEKKRNPKNRRRARRGPRSAGAQATTPVTNTTPGNSSGNEGDGG
jgi:hypothetical protein